MAAGWLQQPARRVYQRPRGPLGWQQIVISLQTLLARNLAVGGHTALELHGFAHYLQQQMTSVYLYGPKKPPTWLQDLDIGVRFVYRNDGRLFRKQRISTAPHRLDDGSVPAQPLRIDQQPFREQAVKPVYLSLFSLSHAMQVS